jgi:hypothetical protein
MSAGQIASALGGAARKDRGRVARCGSHRQALQARRQNYASNTLWAAVPSNIPVELRDRGSLDDRRRAFQDERSAAMIRIIFHRAFDRYGNRLKGRFVASLDGRKSCISQNPFVAAAGVLISAGYSADVPIAGPPKPTSTL